MDSSDFLAQSFWAVELYHREHFSVEGFREAKAERNEALKEGKLKRLGWTRRLDSRAGRRHDIIPQTPSSSGTNRSFVHGGCVFWGPRLIIHTRCSPNKKCLLSAGADRRARFLVPSRRGRAEPTPSRMMPSADFPC